MSCENQSFSPMLRVSQQFLNAQILPKEYEQSLAKIAPEEFQEDLVASYLALQEQTRQDVRTLLKGEAFPKIRNAGDGFNTLMLSVLLRTSTRDEATHRLANYILAQFLLVKSIDEEKILLAEHADRQKWLARMFHRFPQIKAHVLRTLIAYKLLSPSPEIHWRVDRQEQERGEYSRRFGVDITDFLLHCQADSGRLRLLEFGPGSGMYKEERYASSGINAIDMAICDKIYYSLGTLLESLLNAPALDAQARALYTQEHGACPDDLHLSAADIRFIADFLYKIVVIARGQTAKGQTPDDMFEYDTDAMKRITEDPESLIEILCEKAKDLEHITQVPSTISSHNGHKAYYPHVIQKVAPETNPLLRFAFEALGSKPADFLDTKKGVLQHMPAYPIGVMVGDFQQVEKLADDQIDVALGVRSLVYKRGKEYIELMKMIAKKLSTNGVLLCDSIRCNDGKRYRLAEWQQIQRDLRQEYPDLQIGVMIGPAFEREDWHQGNQGVPLAVVMTKDPAKIAYFQDPANMLPPDPRTGALYHFELLDELTMNTEYLQQLTQNGEIAHEVAQGAMLAQGV